MGMVEIGATGVQLYHWIGIWDDMQYLSSDIILQLGKAGAWAVTGNAAILFPYCLQNDCCIGTEVKNFPPASACLLLAQKRYFINDNTVFFLFFLNSFHYL